MGKLNIAHHKSYHPYRRDNIERVRKDEEEARLKEASEEGRIMLADSEARIDLLRERAGASKPKRVKDDDLSVLQEGSTSRHLALQTSGGHINLFEDLEQQQSITAAIHASKKKLEPAETEKGVPLAPSAKDLKPWYSEKSAERNQELEEERKKRDTVVKSMNDPLTSITHQLATRPSATASITERSRYLPRSRAAPQPSSSIAPEVDVRLARESSERQRALDLIRRKKREIEGNETPSTVQGGYGDVFNRREVEEAHRIRDRRWDSGDSGRGWGGGRGRSDVERRLW